MSDSSPLLQIQQEQDYIQQGSINNWWLFIGLFKLWYFCKSISKDVSFSDLGYKSLSQLPDIYQNIVPGLKKGKPSAIIIAPNGLHSLLLVDKREPESIQFEQAKMSLYRESMAKEITLWLDKLKQSAYIKLY